MGIGYAGKIIGSFQGNSLRIHPVRADLHIHTVLSPCAEVEMIPQLIISKALEKQLGLIAITDHNASANILSVQKAAGLEVVVMPGMEVQTKEEVHVLCFFDTLEQIKSLQSVIDAALPAIKNEPEHFGEQYIVDETGGFLRSEDRLLLTSIDLGLTELWKCVSDLEGLLIPAHVDRKAFGLIENLGFLPDDINIEAVEISKHITSEKARVIYPQLASVPILQNGDAHRLDEISSLTTFYIAETTISEMIKAIRGEDGRYIQVG